MLRTEVDGVVTDLSVAYAALSRGLDGAGLVLKTLHAIGVGGMGKVRVDGLKGGALVGELVGSAGCGLGKGADG